MRVSVIVTVKNEEGSISRLLDSLLAQTLPPDEVILADGGSTDRTREIAQSYAARGLPLRLVDAAGSSISQGRNIAIRAATGDVIASTDAGVRLEPSWLAELVKPLAGASVVSGFFLADARTVFEAAMGATVLPDVSQVDPATFLPSSRSVAFTREAWERVGGYPEWLDYSEDLVFDLRLQAAGCRFAFAPRAIAHFRPRSSLRAFAVQYYHYARGDGKADLWRRRHAARYATYLLALPLLLAVTLSTPALGLLLLLLGALVYLWTPYRRLGWRLLAYSWPGRAYAVLLVPLIRVTGDLAKMLGYPVGCLWRWQHRRDPRLAWRAV